MSNINHVHEFAIITAAGIVDTSLPFLQTLGMVDESIYKRFGRAVASRRTALKLTQSKLGELVGLSRASIANIESGRQNVLLHQVYNIADALQCAQLGDLLPKPDFDRQGEDIAMNIADDHGVTARGKAQITDLIHSALARRGSGKSRA